MSTQLEINTKYVHPPIPVRIWDWEAWFDGHEDGGPLGHGRTEQDAIADLKRDAEESGFSDWYGEEPKYA